MNSSAFEKLRLNLQAGNPAAIRELLLEGESYCIGKLKQKANCSRVEAEQILRLAILTFREKVLSKKIVAVANLKEYLFFTCWEIWREKKYLAAYRQQGVKQAFYEIAKKAYSRDVQESILDNTEAHFDRVLDATRWAFERLEEKGKQILLLFYHQKCDFKQIQQLMQLASEAEAIQLKSHHYDLWMKEMAYLMEHDRV